MEGDVRRKKVLQLLNTANEPISGTLLAKEMGVSRQVIVQDVALLRARNKNILSTNKGYIIYSENKQMVTRTFPVKHSNEEIGDELRLIVEYGGKILDVVVEHEIYGQITVDLFINNKKDVDEFVEKLDKGNTTPLKELTGGIHFHTVEAGSEALLKVIEEKLKEKGYLIDTN
ncbi:MAG: transcription repressor NadR [Clostridiales bacterium]|nr:transcription repressor NadR [Clostridiales bacterium]